MLVQKAIVVRFVVMSKEHNIVKYCRASYKTLYHKYKDDKCFVCGSTKNLELHHNFPLAFIVRKFVKDNPKLTKEEVREAILEQYQDAIAGEDSVVTLCRLHHKSLHDVFGKTYNLKVSEKVKRYLKKQQEKCNEVH